MSVKLKVDNQTALAASEDNDSNNQRNNTNRRCGYDYFSTRWSFRVWHVLLFLLTLAVVITMMGLSIAMYGSGNTTLSYSSEKEAVAEALSTDESSSGEGEVTKNAFSSDINKCLFTSWTLASGNKNAVLRKPVDCKGWEGSAVQLCYSVAGKPLAQFAVCYNKATLTSDFSGHVVKPNIAGAGRESDWRHDTGQFAPHPQAAVADYDPFRQRGLYDNYDIQNQYFCARGHLTPNADFNDDDERELTMITTNIAPQWQKFNSMNWAALEAAVRKYATNVTRNVFVFTGVGGKKRNSSLEIILLNRRVLTPMWYWKAVCDPGAGQSIVFVGENPVGDASNTKVVGCNNITQTKDRGVIYCYSLNDALKSIKYKDFKLPPFNDKNCKPAVKGTFMDNFLNGLK